MGRLLLLTNDIAGAGSSQQDPVLLEDGRVLAVGAEALGASVDRTLRLEGNLLPGLIDLLAAKGMSMDGLATRHTSLEDVFVKLTGRLLRDGDAE